MRLAASQDTGSGWTAQLPYQKGYWLDKRADMSQQSHRVKEARANGHVPKRLLDVLRPCKADRREFYKALSWLAAGTKGAAHEYLITAIPCRRMHSPVRWVLKRFK